MKKTFILLAIAIALAAYIYIYEIKGGEERQKAKEASEKIFGFEKDSIKTIQIQSFRGHYKIVRMQDGWQIEEPVKTMADQSTINSLLNSLTSTKKTRTFNISANEKFSYGMGPGGIRIISHLSNDSRDTLYLGQTSGIGSDVYASRIDTVVHLVSSSLKSNADKSLFDWRDKNAIHFDKNEVRSFTMVNLRDKFEFSKDDDGWKMLSPIETVAEESEVNAILNKLDNGRIKEVAAETADNLRKYKLHQPAYRVDLTLGVDKTRAGISFSAVDDNRAYGKDDARLHVFEVDSTFMKPFKAGLFQLRDKKIFDFNTNDVDRMNLLYQGNLMTVVKDTADNWTLSSGEKARSWKITSLLRKISNLKADRFVQENPIYFNIFGLLNPEGKIEVFIKDEKIAELDIGYQKNERVYVYNPHMKPLMAIDDSKLKELFPDKSEVVEEAKEPVTAEDTEE